MSRKTAPTPPPPQLPPTHDPTSEQVTPATCHTTPVVPHGARPALRAPPSPDSRAQRSAPGRGWLARAAIGMGFRTIVRAHGGFPLCGSGVHWTEPLALFAPVQCRCVTCDIHNSARGCARGGEGTQTQADVPGGVPVYTCGPLPGAMRWCLSIPHQVSSQATVHSCGHPRPRGAGASFLKADIEGERQGCAASTKPRCFLLIGTPPCASTLVQAPGPGLTATFTKFSDHGFYGQKLGKA